MAVRVQDLVLPSPCVSMDDIKRKSVNDQVIEGYSRREIPGLKVADKLGVVECSYHFGTYNCALAETPLQSCSSWA